MNGDERLAGLRELLPATGAGIYLDTASRGPLPAETAAHMRQADEWELAVGRAWPGRAEDVAQRAAEAQAVLAALVGADPAQIVLTRGVDEAVELATRQLGLPAEAIELDAFVSEADLLARVAAALDRGMATIVLPHVAPQTGELLPVGSVARLVHRRGARLVLDAQHTAGVLPLAVTTLDVDALALAGDRWLVGPEGTGALWVVDGAAGISAREIGRSVLLGLARSVGWLEMYVGLEWIYERSGRLTRRLYDALAGSDGLELLCPRDHLAAIVSFRLRHWPADGAADELSRRVHVLLSPLPALGALRASVGWFNTDDEIVRFAEAATQLAAHTPATLPRRPGLVMLSDR